MQSIARKMTLDPSVHLPDFSQHLEGYSGADIQAFMYNAHLCCLHDYMKSHPIYTSSSHNTTEQTRQLEFLVTDLEAKKREISLKLENIYAREHPLELQERQKDQPVITVEHFQEALLQSKASLSTLEKRKFEHIYSQFIDKGDGVREDTVGKRSTLA